MNYTCERAHDGTYADHTAAQMAEQSLVYSFILARKQETFIAGVGQHKAYNYDRVNIQQNGNSALPLKL